MSLKIYITILIVFFSILGYSQEERQDSNYHIDTTQIIKFQKRQFKKELKENKKYQNHSLIRTSNNDSILNEEASLYKNYGGIDYIIRIQQKYPISKISESAYECKLLKEDWYSEDQQDWQSFLSCPIGKPNGKLIMKNYKGEAIRECNYYNEKIIGRIIYLKKE